MAIRLTFVMPVRDDASRLKQCLASVAANGHHEECEIVVADNGSRDASPQVAREAGALVVDLPRATVAEMRNVAARNARGDLLAFVDADHLLDQRWVESALDLFRDPGIAAAGAHYSSPNDANWVQRAYGRFRPALRGIRDADWLGSGNLIVPAGGLSKRRRIRRLPRGLRGRGPVQPAATARLQVGQRRSFAQHPSGRPGLFEGGVSGRVVAWPRKPGRDASRPMDCPCPDQPGHTRLQSDVPHPRCRWAIGWPWTGSGPFVVGLAGLGATLAVRVLRMTSGSRMPLGAELAGTAAVASAYELARALALVFRATHQTRRGAVEA
jgi:hypothetical protein